MTREDYAEALLRDVQGLDVTTPTNEGNDMSNPYGYDRDLNDDVFGADDPVKSAGLSTLAIQLSVANAAALSLDLFKIDDSDAAALPTGVVSPLLVPYKNVIRYIASNPSMLKSVIVASNETSTGGAPLLASLRITPKRVTPFGLTASNEVRVQSYQTTQDFQSNRITVPLAVALDGFSFLNLVTDTNNSGAAVVLNVTMFIGQRNDGRKALRGQPMMVRPGGRGPAPVR